MFSPPSLSRASAGHGRECRASAIVSMLFCILLSSQSLCTMTEERSAKLKLKRKKFSTTVRGAQETEIKLQSLPAVDLRQNSAGSWFDEIDLTTAEQLWKQVLTCMSTDLRSVGWRSVPGLPHFTHQVARQGQEKTTVLEVFEVGHRSFEWFALPTALSPTNSKEPCTTDLRHEPSHEQLAEPMLSKSRNQSLQSPNALNNLEPCFMLPGSKENDRVAKKNSTDDHEELQSGATKNIKEPMAFQRSSAESVKAPLTSQKSFIKSIKVPQGLQKGLVDNLKLPKTSQKRSKKAIQGTLVSQKGSEKNVREPQTLPKQTVHLWPTVTLAKNSKGKEEPKWAEPPTQKVSEFNDVIDIEESVSANEGKLQVMQESADKTAEAAGSLDNCPICLMQFPKQFAQLDMDSHLAQCLSETTVDVVW